jgi:hypothetical protein
MPRINPLRKTKPAETKSTKTDKPAANPPPATNVVPVNFIPPLPLWKQRTTVHRRFTIP